MWKQVLDQFVKVVPVDYKHALAQMARQDGALVDEPTHVATAR